MRKKTLKAKKNSCDCLECQDYFRNIKTPQDLYDEEMTFLRSAGVTIKKVQDFEEGLKLALSLK
jgi:hypothetical protein